MALTEEYTKTYTSFSGCDITAAFNGKIIGELQGITYSVSREKAPIYTMGSAEPRSFSRGKRGIAGTLVFTVFDRDALIEEFKDKLNGETLGIQKLATTGGFLKSGNTTLMIGVEIDKVDVVINVIEEVCKRRKQVVSTQPGLSGESGMYMPFPLEVEVGGATVFVIDVDKFVKI